MIIYLQCAITAEGDISTMYWCLMRPPLVAADKRNELELHGVDALRACWQAHQTDTAGPRGT